MFSSDVLPLYRISYMWYTFVGAMSTVVIAVIASFVFGSRDVGTVDKKLLAPCIRKYFNSVESADADSGMCKPSVDKESIL